MSLDVAPDVAWVRGQEARIVLLDLRDLTAAPQVLADNAATIWEALALGGTREATIATVAAAYGLEPADVADDVTAFLVDLTGRGLLVER